MTPAQVTRNRPLATPHVQSHTTSVPIIAQCAHPRTCHSRPRSPREGEEYPISRRRKASVINGTEAKSVASNTAGDNARRNGLRTRRRVVSVKSEEAVCISRGNVTSRRAVKIDSTSGTNENKRKLASKNQQIFRWHKLTYSPYSFTPCWLFIAIPHEATYECPYSRYKKCCGYEDRCCKHDRLHKYAQEQYMYICNNRTREYEDGEQWHGVQQRNIWQTDSMPVARQVGEEEYEDGTD